MSYGDNTGDAVGTGSRERSQQAVSAVPASIPIAETVANLTPAQRIAMSRFRHGADYVWAWNRQCFSAMERKGLVTHQYGNTGILTPLGHEVRNILVAQGTSAGTVETACGLGSKTAGPVGSADAP